MGILEQAVAQLEGAIVRAERSNDQLSVRILQQAQQVILEVIAPESPMPRLVASDEETGSDELFDACIQDAADLLIGDAAQPKESMPKLAAKF